MFREIRRVYNKKKHNVFRRYDIFTEYLKREHSVYNYLYPLAES